MYTNAQYIPGDVPVVTSPDTVGGLDGSADVPTAPSVVVPSPACVVVGNWGMVMVELGLDVVPGVV